MNAGAIPRRILLTHAAPEAFTAPCGKECKSKAGASAHARNCDDCKATEAPSE